MRALVTGGAGCIGSTLVDRLIDDGHEVDVVDDLSSGSLANLSYARSLPDRRLRFHQLDVRHGGISDLIARRPPEVIFHLAAQADVRVSVAKPLFDAEVNIFGTIQVLEAARNASVRRVVFAASGGTLYGQPTELPVPEDAPKVPLSPYGVSKKAAVDYLMAYRELYEIECVSLALANVYGPRQDPHGEAGVVAIFAGNLLAGRRCTIYGDGSQTRDFVYVDDVVDAFVRAADRGDGMLLNIGTGTETSVSDLFKVISASAGVEADPRYVPARPGELARSALDPSRAAVHLGWRASTRIEDGVAATMEHMGMG